VVRPNPYDGVSCGPLQVVEVPELLPAGCRCPVVIAAVVSYFSRPEAHVLSVLESSSGIGEGRTVKDDTLRGQSLVKARFSANHGNE